jgi:RNA polymerase sigma factor (sigma-70 family)
MNTRHELADDTNNLIKACLRNDRRAQLILYERYAKSMYNSALRIVKDSMTAEDIVQDSYITAYRSLGHFRQEVPFSAWLRRIVINRSLDHLRKNQANFEELNEGTYAQSEFIDNTEAVEQESILAEQLKQIKKTVMSLPEGYRIIFSLYYYEGYDHNEIAEIMNISASTSRSQLTRAKQKIIETLNLKSRK